MNNWSGIGRLTSDPDTRYTSGDNPLCVSRYTLAVDRSYKRQGEPDADFIRCVAFGKQGEFAEKYLRKGTKVAITGRIQTGSYTNKDGQKVYTTDVVVEDHEFAESKNANGGGNGGGGSYSNAGPAPDGDDGFMNIAEGIDDEMPFGS
jgi:single-strand DNA-binding protein